MTFVLAASPIPVLQEQPRATCEGQALLAQAWAQALAFLLPPTSPGLAQHCSSLLTASGSCNPGLKDLLSPLPGEPLAVPALSGASDAPRDLEFCF